MQRVDHRSCIEPCGLDDPRIRLLRPMWSCPLAQIVQPGGTIPVRHANDSNVYHFETSGYEVEHFHGMDMTECPVEKMMSTMSGASLVRALESVGIYSGQELDASVTLPDGVPWPYDQ
jgi:hypothetical protein